MQSIEVQQASAIRELVYDTHSFDEIAERYGNHYDSIIYDPLTDTEASERLLSNVKQWKEANATVVFTSGVYDLIHLDHKGYLLHAKLAGAQYHYEKYYQRHNEEWQKLSIADRRKLSDEFLFSNQLRLIVSVDGDNSVAKRKSNDIQKGKSSRPITGWLTRARSIADVTIPISSRGDWIRMPVVDAITMHGPEDFPIESSHASLINLASELQPDVWTIFEESEDITSAAPYVASLGNVALRCIAMGDGSRYFTDPILGKFSTTAFVKRFKGEI